LQAAALPHGGRLSDGVNRWVFRRLPIAGQTASAHDVAREARVTAALQSTGVPVPPVISLCQDLAVIGAPFTITTWIDGEVIRERAELDQLVDEELRGACASMIDVLASLHAVDPNAVGLEDFGRPQGFVVRQVALWRRQWEQVKTRELADLERLHSRLELRLPVSAESAILHGDYRIDNLILDPGDPARVRTVLDWELSAFGEPRTDLALMCTYRHPALDAVLGIRRPGRARGCPPPRTWRARTSTVPAGTSVTGASTWGWRT